MSDAKVADLRPVSIAAEQAIFSSERDRFMRRPARRRGTGRDPLNG
jgi:hypothetical protein